MHLEKQHKRKLSRFDKGLSIGKLPSSSSSEHLSKTVKNDRVGDKKRYSPYSPLQCPLPYVRGLDRSSDISIVGDNLYRTGCLEMVRAITCTSPAALKEDNLEGHRDLPTDQMIESIRS